MKVTHVITGLGTGGAEMMLLRLLSATDRDRFQPTVISLTDRGRLGARVEALGIPLHTVEMRPGLPTPNALWRLVRQLRRDQPDLVQTWLYHADLLGGLTARAAGTAPVVWGIHSSNLAPGIVKRGTIVTAHACARLSRWLPAAIVCCSDATRRLHIERGYRAEKMVVIPNGWDLDLFRPDPAARLSVRRELGMAPATPLIGLLARYHRQKGHHLFLEAARQLHARRPDAHFVLAGDGVDWDNGELVTGIETAGLRDRVHLLGARDDTPRLQASFDLATSSSVAVEAFSLVIGEAMACEVPCVVTDVGDSALLVGDTGRVVPAGDATALAAGWENLLALPDAERAALGRRARQRIADHFALPRIVERYEQLYEQIAGVN